MYCELVAGTFAMQCHVFVQYAGDLKALVLLWSWSVHLSSQAVITNNLVLYSHYLRYTKLNTMVRNQLVGQTIVIVMETD